MTDKTKRWKMAEKLLTTTEENEIFLRFLWTSYDAYFYLEEKVKSIVFESMKPIRVPGRLLTILVVIMERGINVTVTKKHYIHVFTNLFGRCCLIL